MIKIDRIISDLQDIKKHPNMYIRPVTPEVLECYLIGLERGVMLSVESSTFNDFVSAGRAARKIRGWQEQPIHLIHQMRAKEMTEDAIIQELLEIEIQIYKILEHWENGN
jgi:hypothetical protein